MNLGDARWPEVAERAPMSVLVVPLGSTEQHGPHLPLSTDTDIATALADRLAAARPDVVIAPALPYGSSGEHAGFAGTLSIGLTALEHVVVELVRSADSFAAVLLISAHGGNAAAVAGAVATLLAEGRRVAAWAPSGYRDAHAGRTETSLLLALDCERVLIDAAAVGSTAPVPELMNALRTGGLRTVSPNGVLGDPEGASAEEGQSFLAAMTMQLVVEVERLVG